MRIWGLICWESGTDYIKPWWGLVVCCDIYIIPLRRDYWSWIPYSGLRLPGELIPLPDGWRTPWNWRVLVCILYYYDKLDNFTLFLSSSSFWYNSIYSSPAYICPWHHTVGQIHSVFISISFSSKFIYYPTNSIFLWLHPYMIHPLKLYPKIFTDQSIPLFFCSRCLIISLENIYSVPTNCSGDSF